MFSMSGELGIEPGAELDHRRHRSADHDPPARRRKNPSQHLHQRALAGTVRSDHAEHLARMDLERHPLQRIQLLVGDLPLQDLDRELLEGPRSRAREPVHQRCVLDFDDGNGHSSTTSVRQLREKTQTPRMSDTMAEPNM